MYESFFGLNQPPFGLTPDTRRFIPLPGHAEGLDLLLYAVQSNQVFVTLIGDVGTGKTLLCRQLINTLRASPYKERHQTLFIGNPMLSAVGLFRNLAERLGVADPGALERSELFDAVRKRILAYTRAREKSLVIVIDEAQALPEDTLEALRLITNMETETRKLVQIVLSGQPELDTVLDQHRFRQLRQRISFTHYLAPLSAEQVEHYVNGRMQTSGYTGVPVFRGRINRMLYRYSHGVPRLLNLLCHKALLSAYGRGDHRITAGDIREAARNTASHSQASRRGLSWWWGLVPLALVAAVLLGLNLAGGAS